MPRPQRRAPVRIHREDPRDAARGSRPRQGDREAIRTACIRDAQERAKQIVSEAAERAAQMVDETEIVRQARAHRRHRLARSRGEGREDPPRRRRLRGASAGRSRSRLAGALGSVKKGQDALTAARAARTQPHPAPAPAQASWPKPPHEASARHSTRKPNWHRSRSSASSSRFRPAALERRARRLRGARGRSTARGRDRIRRLRVLQPQQRTRRHVAHGPRGRGDLRLREVFDAGEAARHAGRRRARTTSKIWRRAAGRARRRDRRSCRSSGAAPARPRSGNRWPNSASLRAACSTASGRQEHQGAVGQSLGARRRAAAVEGTRLVERVLRETLAERVGLAVGREQRVVRPCRSARNRDTATSRLRRRSYRLADASAPSRWPPVRERSRRARFETACCARETFRRRPARRRARCESSSGPSPGCAHPTRSAPGDAAETRYAALADRFPRATPRSHPTATCRTLPKRSCCDWYWEASGYRG